MGGQTRRWATGARKLRHRPDAPRRGRSARCAARRRGLRLALVRGETRGRCEECAGCASSDRVGRGAPPFGQGCRFRRATGVQLGRQPPADPGADSSRRRGESLAQRPRHWHLEVEQGRSGRAAGGRAPDQVVRPWHRAGPEPAGRRSALKRRGDQPASFLRARAGSGSDLEGFRSSMPGCAVGLGCATSRGTGAAAACGQHRG